MLRDFALSGAMEGCEIIESTEESHSEERNGIQEVEDSIPFGSTSPKELTSDELSRAVTGCGQAADCYRQSGLCVTRSPLVTLVFSVPL